MKKKHVATEFFHVVIAVLINIAVVRWISWSFDQTHEFARIIIGEPEVAVAIALIIQFAPNVFLFSQNRIEDPNGYKRAAIFVAFLVLSFVDALTNIGQWMIDLSARSASTAAALRLAPGAGGDFIASLGVAAGLFFAVAVVFAEEVMMFMTVPYLLHHANEIVKSFGGDGWEWMEWAEQTSKSFGSVRRQSQPSP